MKWFALLLAITPVNAHDWYSSACCSNQDCHPIESCSEIVDIKSGLSWNGYQFGKGQIHPSQDNKCHVCLHNLGAANGSENYQPICIYVQDGS